MSLGNKIKMLQYLSSFPSIKKAIPGFYCIDNNIMNKVYNECRGENLISEFSNALKKHIPNLYDEIYRKIGDLPWIIRSSGEEDSYDDIGAGKYISVICSTPQELEDCVARVSLSGIGERAELFDRTKAIYTDKCKLEPISVFVQKLVYSNIDGNTFVCPYFDLKNMNRILKLLYEIHSSVSFERVDCEFVIDTDCGIVSATSITEITDGKINGQISFGFGLFSSQKTEKNSQNSLCYFLNFENYSLWSGDFLKQTSIKSLYLVQVRPAIYKFYSYFYPISKSCKNKLQDTCLNNLPLMDICVWRNSYCEMYRFIKAVSINDAWNKFITLSSKEQKEIKAVFVELGQPNEHASLMFMQKKINVVIVSSIDEIYSENFYTYIDVIDNKIYFSPGKIKLSLDGEKTKYYHISRNSKLIIEKKTPQQFDCNFFKLPFSQKQNEFILANTNNVKKNILGKSNGLNFMGYIHTDSIFFDLIDRKNFEQLPNLLQKKIYYIYSKNITNAECVIAFSKIVEKLICFSNFPIYTNNEMQIYYDKFLKLLEKFNNAKNIYFYYKLISTDKLPNVILVSFLLDSNIIILKNYNKLLNEISNFNSSPDIMSNVKQMAYDYSALKNRVLSKSKAFESVLVAIFQNIVEMFDVRSKELLYAIIENHEKKAEKYIINLIAWCNFLLELKLGGKKIYKWRNWLQGNLNSFWNDYTIYGNVYNKIENPHQVHNWLHQFSLKCFNMNNCYLYSSYIDCFIKEINNFSDEPVVILRVNNDLIEISIPFGVHKSSFIIKKDEICIDFFEAPDTVSGLHGRLVYYQNMLNVLNTSQDHFSIKSSIILTLGTPMIRISIKKYDCDYFNYKEIQLCYWIVRTLFDSSYDFSYVELNELNSVEQLLHEKTFWKTIFEKIIEYRREIDIPVQTLTPRAFVISKFITKLALSENFYFEISNIYLDGFYKAWENLKFYQEKIEKSQLYDEWKQYEYKIDNLILCLVSFWWRETIHLLDQNDIYGITKLKLIKNLFLRRDARSFILINKHTNKIAHTTSKNSVLDEYDFLCQYYIFGGNVCGL